ncbi:MAG: PLP-dependent aminotransferase family protein [Lentisphaeria bacterium]
MTMPDDQRTDDGAAAWLPAVDPARPEPLYRQIAGQLAERIRSGRLAAGVRLPAARELARRLTVNPVTVVTAYRELARQGLVTSRVGSGTRVAGAAGSPGGGRFPLAVLKRIMDGVLERDGEAAFAADDGLGHAALRAALRRYLEGQGIATAGAEVAVFSGAQQGLSVLVRLLVNRDDWVLVERPTYPGTLRLLQSIGARVEAVDVGPAGIDPQAVDRLFRTRPFRLAYVMPVYQNPTGAAYSSAAKRRLLALCREHGVLLLEDDTCSDLDYGRGRQQPLRALARRGDAEQLLYLKSFSHLLLPGFRLGFCLVPERLLAAVRQAKAEADLFTSGFFQRVLAQFLEEGALAAWVQELERREQRRFRRALAAARRLLLPCGVRWLEPAGGDNLWCRLPAEVAAARFLSLAQAAGAPVIGGAEFAADNATADHFRLHFGGLEPAAWEQALGQVAAAVTAARQGGA